MRIPVTAPSMEQDIAFGVTVDYLALRLQLNDFHSTFYGPHSCDGCNQPVITRAVEQGGQRYELAGQSYAEHTCVSQVQTPTVATPAMPQEDSK